MVKLKDLLKEEYIPKPITKSLHNKQVNAAKKIIKDMEKLANQFKKDYKPSTSNRVLYNTMKEWEELVSTAKMKYEGWFEFAKDDTDYVS